MHNIIDIYYFSGTGNTLIIALSLAESLKKSGKTVNFYRIEISNPKEINPNHTIGLAFPVAIFSTYPFVWNFIHQLPKVNQTEIFMLDTMGAFSGGIVGPLKKTLQKKGFNPIGACEFIMPSNYGSHMKSQEENDTKIQKAKEKASLYASKLLAGNAFWPRIPILSDCIRLLSKWKKPWRILGSRISIDLNNCIHCHLCSKICPMHAIQIKDNLPYKDNEKCVMCMRCMSYCPQNTILFQGTKKRYHALDVKTLLGN